MKEYTNNPNEYNDGGRLYVEKIDECHCSRKVGDRYVLDCRIHQRGMRSYTCGAAAEYIEYDPDGKRLWLSEAAAELVKGKIRGFEGHIALVKDGNFARLPLEEMDTVLYYKHEPSGLYSYLLEYADRSGLRVTAAFRKRSLHEMLFDAAYGQYSDMKVCHPEINDLIVSSDAEGLQRNPLYLGAQALGDEQLQAELRQYYHQETEDDWFSMSCRTGMFVFPALSEEFDREFIVDTDTVNIQLLGQSGYKFLHVPYFSMRGKTHAKCEVNPHRKSCIDAARTDAPSISFSEFLGIIKNNGFGN